MKNIFFAFVGIALLLVAFCGLVYMFFHGLYLVFADWRLGRELKQLREESQQRPRNPSAKTFGTVDLDDLDAEAVPQEPQGIFSVPLDNVVEADWQEVEGSDKPATVEPAVDKPEMDQREIDKPPRDATKSAEAEPVPMDSTEPEGEPVDSAEPEGEPVDSAEPRATGPVSAVEEEPNKQPPADGPPQEETLEAPESERPSGDDSLPVTPDWLSGISGVIELSPTGGSHESHSATGSRSAETSEAADDESLKASPTLAETDNAAADRTQSTRTSGGDSVAAQNDLDMIENEEGLTGTANTETERSSDKPSAAGRPWPTLSEALHQHQRELPERKVTETDAPGASEQRSVQVVGSLWRLPAALVETFEKTERKDGGDPRAGDDPDESGDQATGNEA